MPRKTKQRLILDRLLRAGMDARQLADALGLSVVDVLDGAPGPARIGSTAEEELREAVRGLGMRAIARAEHVLHFGSPQQQMTLIRALLQPMLYAARDTSDADRKIGELRDAFRKLMEASDAEPDGPGEATHHPDQGGAARPSAS